MTAYHFFILLLCFLLSGCKWIVLPAGYANERARAIEAGEQFSSRIEKRALPDLSRKVTLNRTQEYAFNSSGELEAAYRDWRAALARVPQSGALGNTNIEFKTLFATENINSFSDIIDTISLEVRQDLPSTRRRNARAEQALAEARASGERFRAAKYNLQRRVTEAYAQLWLNEALQENTRQTLQLLREGNDLASHRFHANLEDSSLPDLQKFQVEILQAETQLREQEISRAGIVGELNALLNRPMDKTIGSPAYPSIRDPRQSDAELFARAVARNAELAAMRRDIEARGAAQMLSNLESRPDYMLGGELGYPLSGGPLMPSLIAGASLPLNRERIHAAIEESLEARQAAEARYRATRSDKLSQLVTALVGLRNVRRVQNDFGSKIIPTTEQLLDSQLTTYGSGGGDILQILDSERMLIDFRKMLLQARADRLQYLAQLQEILAEDLLK